MLLNHLWNLVCEYLPNGGLVVTELYNASDAEIQKLMNLTVYNYLATRIFNGPGLLQCGLSLMEELLCMLKISDGFLGGSFVASLLAGALDDTRPLEFFVCGNSAFADWLRLLNFGFNHNPHTVSTFRRLRELIPLELLAEPQSREARFCKLSPWNHFARLDFAKDQIDFLNNVDTDLFKTIWDGTLVFGSLLQSKIRFQYSQTLMPVHGNFREFVHALRMRKLNCRFRNLCTIANVQMLQSKGWCIDIDAERTTQDLELFEGCVNTNP